MKKLILLVEDNESDEKLTIRALKKTGVEHDSVVQRDGADALDWLFATGRFADRDAALVPTVILLDLNLPKVGGLDVLRRLRADERTKLVPVVMLTTSAEANDIAHALEAGANAYMRKPVNYADFAEAARTFAAFWLTINETMAQAGTPR
jgi:two-component system response regulator